MFAQVSVFHDALLCCRLKILVGMNGYHDSIWLAGFAKCVMAAFDPDQLPAVFP
jgi:hypothetical protein